MRLKLTLLGVLLAACGDDAATVLDLGSLDGGSDAGSAHAPEIRPIVAAAEADLRRNLASCVSVAVWRDDQVEHLFGLGTTVSLEGRAPDEDTLFMIGSDTKKITAAHLLQRAEATGLDLEAPLRELAPELRLPEAELALEVTPHQLLTMQSGLVDYTGTFPASTTDGELERVTVEDLGAALFAMNPPGLFWNYSNPNFALAGWLAERASEVPWADGVEDDLFAPLGMTRSVARRADVDANHASGVGTVRAVGAIGPVQLEATWEDAWIRPAGLVWSTPSDQMRLAAFLVDGDPAVLSDARREAITTPHVAASPDTDRTSYGYGVVVDRGLTLPSGFYPDVAVWSHGGNTLTHTSTWYVLPAQRVAVAILSNGLGDDFRATAAAALEALADLPAPGDAPPALAPVDAVTDALAGRYLDAFSVGSVEFTRTAAGLAVAIPVLDDAMVPYAAALTARSPREWIIEVQGDPLGLRFYADEQGEGGYLVTRGFVARRQRGEALSSIVTGSPRIQDAFAAPVLVPRGLRDPRNRVP
ncbi:MAG: serine hydrolase domain-containing protein [Myxococcota bacterium]